MKKRKEYTMSRKRKKRDDKQTNWALRMQVVQMYEDDKMSFAEIGKKLGFSRANAYMKYHLAKKKLPQ